MAASLRTKWLGVLVVLILSAIVIHAAFGRASTASAGLGRAHGWAVPTREHFSYGAPTDPKEGTNDWKPRATLVLDLDETLVHSELDKTGTDVVRVNVRPHAVDFLRQVSLLFKEVVLFTASLKPYADSVVDRLDVDRVIKRRFYRDSCTVMPGGSYAKDISLVEPDLSRVVLVDNTPSTFALQPENGILISSFYGTNSGDNELLQLIPLLRAVARAENARDVLA